MKKIFFLMVGVLTVLSAQTAFAQHHEITGAVIDAATGDPIPFAAIRLDGTSTGTAAGADGTYSITVPSRETAVLVFSFVGYKTQEVAVNGRAVVDCHLEEDAIALKGTIVVGYGTTNREALTGSVAQVDGETLAQAPVMSIDRALGGKLAGVSVTSISGQPGATAQIRIRGNSSINASNAPLWVVDGIPVLTGSANGIITGYSNILASLNPNDIESITVLKDAASAAVYGSRAAAGVILVTTKSGQEGKTEFGVRVKYGVQWLQADSGFRPMTSNELLTYQRDAIFNAGMNPDDPTSSFYRPLSLLNGKQYNWVNETSRLGQVQDYEVTARGGTSKANYYASLAWEKNDGVYYGSDFGKFTARVNSEFQLHKTLKLGVLVNAGYSTQNTPPLGNLYYESPVWASLVVFPWISPYDPDDPSGYNMGISAIGNANPLNSAKVNEQSSKVYHLNGTMFLRYQPTKWLTIETKNSAELMFTQERDFWSSDAQAGEDVSDVTDALQHDYMLTTSNTITYENVFGGYHSFRALLGQEAMRYSWSGLAAAAVGINKSIPYLNTAPGDDYTSAEWSFTKETMMSYFAIVDYNYDQKYFVQGTVRTDGSSLFGANNKWGVFWSASASWNLANESWLRRVRGVDLLKIRVSYGVNGNNGISAYNAYGVYGATTYNGTTGWLPSSPSNEDLSWEKNATWNVGIDFGFFGSRFNGTIDVYSRTTKDMLLSVQVPYTTGFSSNLMNCGKMRNTGIELELDGDIISTPDFYWNIGGNIAYNKNKILDLGGDDEIVASSSIHYVVGRSLYTYVLKDYYGVNPSTGDALWVADVREDGSKVLTTDYAQAREVYRQGDPKFTGGFNTTFSWKGLSLSAYFEFRAGCYAFPLNESSYLISDGSEMSMNQLAIGNNYWKEPGDTGVNPKPVANNGSNSNYWRSTRFLENGSYIRLKDLTLAYALQPKALSKIHLQGLRFYVSGLNLYCFNDVNYWDPDMGTYGYDTYSEYPNTKSVVAGVEITF